MTPSILPTGSMWHELLQRPVLQKDAVASGARESSPTRSGIVSFPQHEMSFWGLKQHAELQGETLAGARAAPWLGFSPPGCCPLLDGQKHLPASHPKGHPDV